MALLSLSNKTLPCGSWLPSPAREGVFSTGNSTNRQLAGSKYSQNSQQSQIEKQVFETITHPVDYDKLISFQDNVQKIRNEITPKFSELVLKTLSKFNKE